MSSSIRTTRPDPSVGSGAFPFGWSSRAVADGETVVKPPSSDSSMSVAVELVDPRIQQLFPHGGAPAQPAGVVISEYQIEGQLGRGGMGAVFLARDDRLQRQVALKILAPNQSGDAAAVKRFINEARSAARLDHENIARVFQSGEDQGLYFIAYEYVQGSNLRDIIRQRGRIDIAEAVNYTIQLAAALNHTAAAGVVHRDIKPSNIIITPTGRAKLVDLGLARKTTQEESDELTVAGTTLGTFDYISPEQARDPRNVDVRSDIYSLGCTLYHMLTGEPPYPEGTVLQKLLDHQGKSPDPAARNRQIPAALSAIVRRMMFSDPRKRYASPDELIHDLLMVARNLGLRAVPSETVIWSAGDGGSLPFWQQHLGWIATAVALLVLVVVLQANPELLTGRNPRDSVVSEVPEAPSRDNAAGLAAGDSTVEQPSSQTTLPADSLTSSSDVRPAEPTISSASTGIPIQTPVKEPSLASGSSPEPLPKTESEGSGVGLISSLQESALSGTRPPNSPSFYVPADPQTLLDQSEPPALNDFWKSFEKMLTPDASPLSLPADSPPQLTATPDAQTSRAGVPERSPSAVPLVLPSERVFVVGSSKGYSTLESACAEARDGEIIELRFTGPLIEKRPIRLVNKRLTIRAARGHRPIVEFVPDSAPSESSLSRMISLVSGSLEVNQVEFRLMVPELLPADRWVLFSLQNSDQLDLRDVRVGIVNPRQHPAAAIELQASATQSLSGMNMMKESQPTQDGPDVSLIRTFIQGQTDALQVEGLPAARISIQDSIIAVTNSVLQVVTPMDLTGSMQGVKLDLMQSTCRSAGPFLAIQAFDNFSDILVPVQVTARNNLISVAEGHPLVQQQSALTDLVEIRAKLTWSGERNFYDGLNLFWQIDSGMGQVLFTSDYSQWRAFWDQGDLETSQNQPILWQDPHWKTRDVSNLGVDAFQLDRTEDVNPPIEGATNGRDAGAPLVDFIPGA